jgi:hypothetical protein
MQSPTDYSPRTLPHVELQSPTDYSPRTLPHVELQSVGCGP